MIIKQQKGVFIFVIAYSYDRKNSINKRIDDYFVTNDNEFPNMQPAWQTAIFLHNYR